MTQKPKATIGLCVRNAERTVREAINSIINQGFPRELMELIVVDGCSRDKTLAIIERCLSKEDIKYKVFCENEGLGLARQIVVDNAGGDYIVWVDGDMVLSRDFVRKQVEFMERNPAVGIGKGKYGMHNGENLVDILENLEFALNFRSEGKTTLKTLGTSGCIYRIKAIRQVGGFDKNIKGVGEDMDAEHRIKAAGWLLYITSAIFYEKRRASWKSLWREYSWHGYGGHYLFSKNRRTINFYKMLPPIAIAVEVSRLPVAYRLTHRKVVFLLPFHYVFKRVAWFFGFVRAHFDGYGHV